MQSKKCKDQIAYFANLCTPFRKVRRAIYTVNLMRCGLCAQIGFKPVKRSKFETGATRSKKAPSGSLVAKNTSLEFLIILT